MSSKVIAGRYELLEKIGDGGMAVVYKAKCRLLNRFVALKILKPEFTRDAKFIENFRKESHAAASLSHPNIVNIYDVGREGNINYIVMELVEGQTLSQKIQREAPLDYNQVIDITRQIALGLAVAHKNGIIHRDIKPHNILITAEGICKIADFGIAKAAGNTTIIDGTSESVMGSVHYFSPEQARGSYVDDKTDIYSLGIVMFEMLTGKVPFDGDNPVSVALMHINQQMPTPSSLVPNIPPQLEKIVMKATDKYQTNRFKSVEEMIGDLNNIEFVSRVVGDSTYTRITPTADIQREQYMQAQRQGQVQNGQPYVEPVKQSKIKKAGKPVSVRPSKGRRKKKLIIIIAIIVALLAAGLGVAFGTGLIGGANIEVPDVKGMTYQDAEKALKDKGLKISEGDKVYSTEYEEGKVANQDPKAKTKVKKNTVVKVSISKGATDGTVPSLVGLSEADAKKQIVKYDFKVGDIKEERSEKPKGTVIAQDPGAGTEITQGTKINLTISDGQGKEVGSVPDLRGMSVSDAKSAIESAGYLVGETSYDMSPTYTKDKVMSQSPAPGTKLEKGKSVAFTVSTGSKSSINLYVDYSSATQEVFYMTVTVVDDSGTKNVVSNAQRQKSSGGENLTIEGSGSGSITVTFDNKTVYHKNVNFSTGVVN